MHSVIYNQSSDHAYHDGAFLDIRARLARQLMDNVMTGEWIKAVGAEDGSVKFSPRYIAAQCCDAADAMVDEWSRRGWIQPGPTMEEQAKFSGMSHAIAQRTFQESLR